MATIGLDFLYYQPLQEFLEVVEKHQGKIENFKSHGPGGGNPYVEISFPTPELALEFGKWHSPDEDPEFLKSMIK